MLLAELERALLNTGKEQNMPEWHQNETEWTRMVPEHTETNRNEAEWHTNKAEYTGINRNVPEQGGMTLE